MVRISETGWPEVEGLRSRIGERSSSTVTEAAQAFARDLAQSLSSVVLARIFLVVPARSLPADERAIAARMALTVGEVGPDTRVLSLVGTFGREPDWCNRTLSTGHLAIPLIDRLHVEGIPMIAKLLSDLKVDFAGLDDGRPIASQRMLGGINGKFSIDDARTSVDAKGRWVVPSRDFVDGYGVRSVFGMGGAYVDGTLAVAVIFADELVAPHVMDRFPSLISNFKMSTSPLLTAGHVYA